jgi:PDDEXK-like domain of unknown function (DUF3799)
MSVPLRLPPGIHYDIPAAAYHADPCEKPSLSSSIAKVILGKTPKHAWIEHPRLNPDYAARKARRDKKNGDKFDIGSVVHELLLGRGGGLEIIDAEDFRTKDARQRRDDARMAGLTPILAHQYAEAQQIANSATGGLKEMGIDLADNRNHNETVIVWDMHGLPCRSMIDSFGPDPTQIWDIKTTNTGLSEAAISRAIVNNGYDLSAAFYLKGMAALFPHLAGRLVFRWIFVETEEPYEIRVVEADATTLHFGDRKANAALEKWCVCMANNEWPGWPRVVTKSVYPAWAENSWLERELEEAGVE